MPLTRRDFLLSAFILPALKTGAQIRRAPGSPRPLFREASAPTDLHFHHFNGATGEHFMPEIMGPGVALFDYDNDGDLDVYLIQGTTLEPGKRLLFPPPPGWKPGNRLFRNMLSETGKLRFEDVTEKAGVGHIGYGMGAAVGDYDNDGYQDIYVTNFGHNVLYHNNGDGTFTDVTQQAGVDDPRWSTSAAWVDYDSDGRLDLFVCNYVDFTVRGNKRCYAPTGALDYCTPIAYSAVPSRLFHNLGNGKFEDVGESSGIASSYGPGLGVICADFNGDGFADIYVADDTAANRLWINQGNGTFKEEALDDGLAYSGDGLAKAGMGVTLNDIYNDGHLQLLVTNLTREGVTLFRSDGKAMFDDVTAQSGLLQATYGYTGFGTQFFDYDNDGLLDLFIANGAVTIIDALGGSPFPYNEINQLFHNEGRGFREVTAVAGPAFKLSEVSRGVAFGDINNDGKMDFVVSNNNGPVRLMLNESEPNGHWLEVRLEKEGGNRFGIGSRVGVFRKGASALWRRAHTDGSYLSSSDIRVHFGLGANPRIDAVVVQWAAGPNAPKGNTEKWTAVKADRVVTLRQGTGRVYREPNS